MQSESTTTASNDAVPHELEAVHVFSLASGQLYERLLKVMMLSVSKRISGPVKFWLLENFLSPDLKADAQIMAQRLGFEVAFVSYKWPAWLRNQTEQQRCVRRALFANL